MSIEKMHIMQRPPVLTGWPLLVDMTHLPRKGLAGREAEPEPAPGFSGAKIANT